LARHYGGRFVLRIEDTDTERSKQEYTDSILASMRWLGLDSDEEPVYQTQRFSLYNDYLELLLASNKAYWCQCSPEEVESMREKARAAGDKPRYDGRCRTLGLGPGPGRTVRLAAPAFGKVVFEDIVKGTVAFDVNELDDMILRRADGAPTYNFAVVVDDITMNITHVIRGDDHVNNTPRQILIYQAIGAALPVFGHVPMILGSDRQKLSKRHGAKAVIDYEKDGLLPEALINYLVRLGWSHGDQELFFSREEMIEVFDGSSLNSAAAAFDQEKLLWVNAQHLRNALPRELLPRLLPFLAQAGLATDQHEYILRCIPLYQPRANTLTELAEQMRPLLLKAAELGRDPAAKAKFLSSEGLTHVSALSRRLEVLEDFKAESLRHCIHSYVKDGNFSFKLVAPALRVALLGLSSGPDLADVMAVLGRRESLERLSRVISQ
jgi:glutamyl-tRNA synthetase